jgi:hypothetical protein
MKTDPWCITKDVLMLYYSFEYVKITAPNKLLYITKTQQQNHQVFIFNNLVNLHV